MCGRFALDSKIDELIQEFVADGGDYTDWTPNWNIKPTNTVPIVLETTKGDLKRRVEVIVERLGRDPSSLLLTSAS